MMRGSTLAVLLVCAGLVLGLAQAQEVQRSVAAESVIESIKRQGVIRIGLATFTPWSMRAVNGDLIGFEPPA